MQKDSNVTSTANHIASGSETGRHSLIDVGMLCRLAANFGQAKAKLLEAEDQIRKLTRERKRAVREAAYLRKAYKHLKELDRKKDIYLSSVSHELRTPLTSIVSFAEILLNYPDESPETKSKFYSIIKRESERLTRLINNLLDLSKIQAEAVEFNIRPCEAKTVFQKTVEALKPLLLRKELQLDYELEKELPIFLADEDRIIQVLTNLIGNSIKFTPRHGKIWVAAKYLQGRRSEDEDGLIHISVSDTGIGILPNELPAVFDRFKQCKDTLTEKPRGTGLGLPICKEIISRHRGNIWAESVFGKGSTFHITLPVDLNDLDSKGKEVFQASTAAQEKDENFPEYSRQTGKADKDVKPGEQRHEQKDNSYP